MYGIYTCIVCKNSMCVCFMPCCEMWSSFTQDGGISNTLDSSLSSFGKNITKTCPYNPEQLSEIYGQIDTQTLTSSSSNSCVFMAGMSKSDWLVSPHSRYSHLIGSPRSKVMSCKQTFTHSHISTNTMYIHTFRHQCARAHTHTHHMWEVLFL